ncbi:MAG TPA: SCO family protein [Conexibacter sp.]|nr:SCO family protein [Conexibacter sp.]
MPARLRLTLVVAGVCLLAGLALVVLLGGSGASTVSAADPTGFHGALRPPQARAIDFRLRDQDGHVATMDEYRGRTVIVTFMYSTCRDTCPLTAQQIRGGLDDLGRAGSVPVLAISVDPTSDTPLHVKRFLVTQHMVGRMRYLVGTRAQLSPIWRAYGIQPQGPGYEHTASTVIVDGAGRQRIGYLTDQLTPEALADDLRALSTDGAARAAR